MFLALDLVTKLSKGCKPAISSESIAFEQGMAGGSEI